jgi:hypothetical protein
VTSHIAFTAPRTIDAATLPLYGATVLIVQIATTVIGDESYCQLLIAALRVRYPDCTAVLVARGGQGPPTYYGPLAMVRALLGLPFDALTFATWWLDPPMLPIARPARLDSTVETREIRVLPGARKTRTM